MFQYDFMQHAFVAGTLVALMCGAIGVFVIARNLSFITHTFSHIGFAGAAFAVLIGISPLSGLLLFTMISALFIGQMGVRMFRRDASISVILSLFLGLGILFLSLSNKQANFTTSILFGSVIGINVRDVREIAVLSFIVLLLIALGYRWLKFDSFDQTGAEAAGLPIQLISVGFLLLLSVAVSVTVQIIGALLVFALMTVPAAAARCFVRSIFGMIILSSALAVLGVWFGLVMSYYTNAPVSFFITSFEAAMYFIGLGFRRLYAERNAMQE
ncbi:metal ABC transporter permease [Sporolactobacillus sp. THM19-2]|uniref:metal ABC transporter permease n=1 Tax=Sporolactobacillus sp. THM19-2 TaxID=2511171 RepID=UPI001020E072|nr:metal ABC transporter permease [Sporolactobacillus sp. THM19-2]RYL94436.1 metal ABC transporter permease [Sporolactobacillus sp. THM19-2]